MLVPTSSRWSNLVSVIKCVRSNCFPPLLELRRNGILMNKMRSSSLLKFGRRFPPELFLSSLERSFLGLPTDLIIVECLYCIHFIIVHRNAVCLGLLLIYTSHHGGPITLGFTWGCGQEDMWEKVFTSSQTDQNNERFLYLFPCSHLIGR